MNMLRTHYFGMAVAASCWVSAFGAVPFESLDCQLFVELAGKLVAYQSAPSEHKQDCLERLNELLQAYSTDCQDPLLKVPSVIREQFENKLKEYQSALLQELDAWLPTALMSAQDQVKMATARSQINSCVAAVRDYATKVWSNDAIVLCTTLESDVYRLCVWLDALYRGPRYIKAAAAKLAVLTYPVPTTQNVHQDLLALTVDYAWARTALVDIWVQMVNGLQDAWLHAYGWRLDNHILTGMVQASVPPTVTRMVTIGWLPWLMRVCKRIGFDVVYGIDECVATDSAMVLQEAYEPFIAMHRSILTGVSDPVQQQTKINTTIELLGQRRGICMHNQRQSEFCLMLIAGLLAYRARLAQQAAMIKLPLAVQVALCRAQSLRDDPATIPTLQPLGTRIALFTTYQALVDRFTRGAIDVGWMQAAQECMYQLEQERSYYGYGWWQLVRKDRVGHVLTVAVEVLRALLDHAQGNDGWFASLGRGVMETVAQVGDQIKRGMYTQDGRVLVEFANAGNASSQPFASLKAAGLYACAVASPFIAQKMMALLAPYTQASKTNQLGVPMSHTTQLQTLERELQKPQFVQMVEQYEPMLVSAAGQALQQKFITR